jgi:hypothetical protein
VQPAAKVEAPHGADLERGEIRSEQRRRGWDIGREIRQMAIDMKRMRRAGKVWYLSLAAGDGLDLDAEEDDPRAHKVLGLGLGGLLIQKSILAIITTKLEGQGSEAVGIVGDFKMPTRSRHESRGRGRAHIQRGAVDPVRAVGALLKGALVDVVATRGGGRERLVLLIEGLREGDQSEMERQKGRGPRLRDQQGTRSGSEGGQINSQL